MFIETEENGNVSIFAKMKTEVMIDEYEKQVRELLQWILSKIDELSDRNFPKSLAGMQTEIQKFKQYRTIEKPERFKERSNIDKIFFQIITNQEQNRMKTYVPPEGLLLKEVEVACDNLKKAEHARKLALCAELVNPEKLEKNAIWFQNEAGLIESWLNDQFQYLIDTDIEFTINEDAFIENEETTNTKKFQNLDTTAYILKKVNYFDRKVISDRNSEIQFRWQEFQNLMAKSTLNYDNLQSLINIIRTLNTISTKLENLQSQITSTEVGQNLIAATALSERHKSVYVHLTELSNNAKKVQLKCESILTSPSSEILTKKLRESVRMKAIKLNSQLTELVKQSQNRREQLFQNCNFHILCNDLDDEDLWIRNIINNMKNNGHYRPSVQNKIRRHMDVEIVTHETTWANLIKKANQYIKDHPFSSKDIQNRVKILNTGWDNLKAAQLP